jgi:molybdopterin-guanine dinucleotide biosynthesis protein A
MDAVIIAGGKLTGPLRQMDGPEACDRKALLAIGNRNLLQRVLDACTAAECVSRIVVAGAEDGTGFECSSDTLFLPDAGSMIGNILTGAKHLRLQEDAGFHFLTIACDLPYLRGATLDWLCRQTGDSRLDFYYSVVPKETMEKSFPGSGRTYYRMKEGLFCSGDAQVFSFHLIDRLHPLLQRITEKRKSPLRLAMLLGPVLLFRFLTGRLTHEAICSRIGRELGVTGKVVVSPYAEIGMDIDKLAHLKTVPAPQAESHEHP